MTNLIHFGVMTPISAIWRHKGCFVCEIEGYALSHPDSAELYTVCLVAPREANKGIGPEIAHPMHASPGSDERRIADLLWKEAEAVDTTERLREAWAEYQYEQRNAYRELQAQERRLGLD